MELGDGYNVRTHHDSLPTSDNRAGRRAHDSDAPTRAGLQHSRKRPGDDDGRKFLCPFYIRDRLIWHDCCAFESTRTSDVRQHLFRIHTTAPFCPTCGITFDNDLEERRLNDHIKDMACQGPFIVPGMTTVQADSITRIARQRSRHRVPPVERWLEMWRVIFPGLSDPDSPYSSGETYFIRRLSDIRDAIATGQWRTLAPGLSWMSVEQRQLSVIDNFIAIARHLQGNTDSATPKSNSIHTLSEVITEAPNTLGHSWHINSTLSSSRSQPPATQAGGAGGGPLPAAMTFQNHFTPLTMPLELGNQGLEHMHQYSRFFSDDSGQPLANSATFPQEFLDQINSAPWSPYFQS